VKLLGHCWAAALAAFLLVPSLEAQTPRRFVVDDVSPLASVPSKEERMRAPLDFGYWLMDVTERADLAFHKGEFERAARYYEAVTVAVPERSVGFTKLCESYRARGDVDRATDACRKGLGLAGVTTADYTQFLELLLVRDARLSAAALADVEAIFAHLRAQSVGPAFLAELECRVGLHEHDEVRLGRCVSELVTHAGQQPRTVSYQWALALLRKDRTQALALVEQGRGIGMTAQEVERMQRVTYAELGRFDRAWLLVIGGVLAVLSLGAWWAFGRRQPRVEGPAGQPVAARS